MTISKLIAALGELEVEHGDIEIRFAANAESDDDDLGSTVPIEGVVVFCEPRTEEADYALICDLNTLDALS